jgi:hypothetical protein
MTSANGLLHGMAGAAAPDEGTMSDASASPPAIVPNANAATRLDSPNAVLSSR